MLNQLINDLKTDYAFLSGFLSIVIVIFVVLPSIVIIYYLKEKQLINFSKSKSKFFRNRILFSLLFSLLISLPYILSGKLSLIFSLGLILILFLVFFPFFTVICSKGKELIFDSENKPIPKYGKNNHKRRRFGFLLILLGIVNLFGLHFLEHVNVTINRYLEIYYSVATIFTIVLAFYFLSIVECKYCSCLNLNITNKKTCKNCSLDFK